MKNRLIWVAPILAAACVWIRPAATAPAASGYTATPLGTLPGTAFTQPYSINEGGVVVGAARTAEMDSTAFLWQAGKLRALPGLPKIGNSASAINAAGDVAGQISEADGVERGFLISGGKLSRLPRPKGSQNEWVSALNAKGDVCGFGHTADGEPQACLWPKGAAAPVDLHSLIKKAYPQATQSRALGINDQGMVVGEALEDEESGRAFLYAAGKVTILQFLGAKASGADAINNAGAVAGWANPGKGGHLVLYQAGKAQDLGLLTGYSDMNPTAINGRGEIIGFAQESDNSEKPDRAFLYRAGKIQDLTGLLPAGSGITVNTPRALNSKGQIAASGTQGGKSVGLLLAPR
jgi:probable HAF family extracellular repeat protein